MVNQPPSQTGAVAELHATVMELQDTVQQLEAERQRLIRRRRRQVLLVGAMLSLIVHITLLMYLSQVYRWGGGNTIPEPVSFQFAIEQDEELTELEKADLSDLLEEAPAEMAEAADPAVELEVQPPAAELEVAGPAALPALGGSGADSGANALSGGGAGTSFFGISAKGRRFAYIVDRSGSMSQSGKMSVAKRELAQSIQSLPDYAHFYVVLFSSGIVEPSTQNGWTQARRTMVTRFIAWLNGSRDAEPTGGTQPRPAFVQIFSLDVRPDVIYFLTDGEISNFTAEEVAQMNGNGRRVVINTIAFGDPTSQDLLKRIAEQSGGVYRFVPSGGY